MRVEEPSHLVVQPRAFAPAAASNRSHAQPTHEPGERGPQEQLAGLGPHGLGAHPGQQQTGEIPVGQAGLAHGRHDQRVGTIDAFVLKLPARVLVRGREHSAIIRPINPRSASASLAPTSCST